VTAKKAESAGAKTMPTRSLPVGMSSFIAAVSSLALVTLELPPWASSATASGIARDLQGFTGSLSPPWRINRIAAPHYTPPDSYHYSGFTNLWYTFEYRCQDGTRPALDMGLTTGRLQVEQVE
jgi:hypothetical protein